MEYGMPSGRRLFGAAVFVVVAAATSVLGIVSAAVPSGANERESQVAETVVRPTTIDQVSASVGSSISYASQAISLGALRDTVSSVVNQASDPGELVGGTRGLEVAVLQQQLTDLGYRPGPVDGAYGAQTASAVLAFQKFESLDRTHTATAAVHDRIANPQGAGPRSDILGTRVEIDIVRQVLLVVGPDGTYKVINTSTGGNYEYVNPKTGDTNVAYTPTGSFAVGYRYDGLEVAPLGELYRPLYFYGGWAIHGSTSVPEYPASHGCARTSFTDQDWIWDQIPSGTPVYVY